MTRLLDLQRGYPVTDVTVAGNICEHGCSRRFTMIIDGYHDCYADTAVTAGNHMTWIQETGTC